jgi:hypothetical protein
MISLWYLGMRLVLHPELILSIQSSGTLRKDEPHTPCTWSMLLIQSHRACQIGAHNMYNNWLLQPQIFYKVFVYASFQSDPLIQHKLNLVGVNNILWSMGRHIYPIKLCSWHMKAHVYSHRKHVTSVQCKLELLAYLCKIESLKNKSS